MCILFYDLGHENSGGRGVIAEEISYFYPVTRGRKFVKEISEK